ncbi:hypothetical protein JW921_05820, partial [Candidatus Fermentibacterales bacterium]|nr:hypothetical protein [Candidatus Fermentibacterales bacterium]
IERLEPDVPREWYEHYHPTPSNVSPMASFGSGYRFHVTGLTHDKQGFPTRNVTEVNDKMLRLKHKVTRRLEELVDVQMHDLAGARIAIFAYGSVYRSALAAREMLRKEENVKVGIFRPVALWPFPDKLLKENLDDKDIVLVPELNQGQVIHEVERMTSDSVRVVPLHRVDGYEITPEEIVSAVLEVM